MAKRTGWHEPSNLIAAIAGFLSLISLLVSMRSCVVSDKSLDLARTEFQSQRSIILGGTVASDGNSIEVKSLDPAIVLQQGNAVFPSEIDKQEWPILPPEHRLYVVVLRLSLQKVLEQKVGRETGKAAVSLDANVPVVITSLYTAKGEAFEDRALYRIMYSFVIGDEITTPPKIDFKGLIYVQRLDVGQDPRSLLDQLWQQTILQKTAT